MTHHEHYQEALQELNLGQRSVWLDRPETNMYIWFFEYDFMPHWLKKLQGERVCEKWRQRVEIKSALLNFGSVLFVEQLLVMVSSRPKTAVTSVWRLLNCDELSLKCTFRHSYKKWGVESGFRLRSGRGTVEKLSWLNRCAVKWDRNNGKGSNLEHQFHTPLTGCAAVSFFGLIWSTTPPH